MSFSPDLSLSSIESPEGKNRLELLYNLRNYPPITNMRVVKMINIPFDISTDDILDFFSPLKIPFGHKTPHYTTGVHIPMQIETGKTISECFVELENDNDASEAIKIRKYVKGRLISVVASSQDELFSSLFPSFKQNASYELIPGLTMGDTRFEGCFLSQQEINWILMVCKRFKLHYSRKCAERPFELVISILSKMPWHQTNVITLLQRDHLFEMFKIAVESLVIHLSKSTKRYLEEGLLVRLIRAGLTVPLFTEKQKLIVLSVSHLVCPKDLESFVFNPPEVEDASPNICSSPFQQKAPRIDAAVKIPFQTPSSQKRVKSNYSLFDSQSQSRLNHDFPSPVSLRFSSDSNPWFSPLSEGSTKEKLIIPELEKKLDEYRQKLKASTDQLASKNGILSDLQERNGKLRDRLRSSLVFIKSLQRRNDELEYIHFKSNKTIWGTDGLHLEYTSWKDM